MSEMNEYRNSHKKKQHLKIELYKPAVSSDNSAIIRTLEIRLQLFYVIILKGKAYLLVFVRCTVDQNPDNASVGEKTINYTFFPFPREEDVTFLFPKISRMLRTTCMSILFAIISLALTRPIEHLKGQSIVIDA